MLLVGGGVGRGEIVHICGLYYNSIYDRKNYDASYDRTSGVNYDASSVNYDAKVL